MVNDLFSKELVSKEELIISLFKLNGYKTYYDLGAYPTIESVRIFNRLIDMEVDIYAFEPSEELYNSLVKKFASKIHNYKIGLSDKNEDLLLYNLPGVHGASSFDKKFLLERDDYEKRGKSPDFLEVYTTKSCTVILYDFIEKNNLPVPDLIKIDVENWEIKILRSIDFSKYRPELILFSHSKDTLDYMKIHLKNIYNINKKIFVDEEHNYYRHYFYLSTKEIK